MIVHYISIKVISEIFSLQQIQKAQEHNKGLYEMFVDLTTVFNSVCQQPLWKVLAMLEILEQMLNIIVSIHNDLNASVLSNGNQSQPFYVRSSMKQDCFETRLF